jgi:hypothetical protein
LKILLLILSWAVTPFIFCQAKDSTRWMQRIQSYKPEILTSGFIDIINNGQINASARFIRLFIGEPGGFSIPLSIYSGVSSNNFQNQQTSSGLRTNEQLVNSYINPLSGLANLSFDGIIFFNKKLKLTRAGYLYHTGIRVLTGYKSELVNSFTAVHPINFFNSFYTGGLYFQTGAWERNNAKNIGLFWITGRYIFCKSAVRKIHEILPDILTNAFYHGWSLAWGIEINGLLNIKVIYYQYVKKPEIEYSLPIYQFSFNYTLKG